MPDKTQGSKEKQDSEKGSLMDFLSDLLDD